VFVVADKDPAGRTHAQNVAAALHGKAQHVSVIELPNRNGHKVKDAADWIAAGGKASDLTQLLDAAPEWLSPPQAQSSADVISERLNSDRPKVELPCDGRLLSTFAAELAGILKHHGVYQRGGL